MLRSIMVGLAVVAGAGAAARGEVLLDFDDVALPAETAWYGAPSVPGNPGFTAAYEVASGEAVLNTHYAIDPDYAVEFWGGWALSNTSDTTTGAYTNLSAVPGAAHSGANYGLAYVDTWNGWTPTVTFAGPTVVDHAFVTNATYPYLIMRDGDPFGWAKQFGGADGTDPDWFRLTIAGKDAAGDPTAAPVEVYLADFRSSDPADDYIVDAWLQVSLASLGEVASLEFTLDSSDTNAWGQMNTPSYFALDSMSAAPEPATLVLAAAGAALLAARRRRG